MSIYQVTFLLHLVCLGLTACAYFTGTMGFIIYTFYIPYLAVLGRLRDYGADFDMTRPRDAVFDLSVHCVVVASIFSIHPYFYGKGDYGLIGYLALSLTSMVLIPQFVLAVSKKLKDFDIDDVHYPFVAFVFWFICSAIATRGI